MNFENKTVIITGGSAGVGAATARAFAAAGANLVLVARGKKELEAIAAELRDKTRVEIMPMDVSDLKACSDLFKKAHFEFGRIDVLVNNAGYHQRGPVQSIEPGDLATMIDVNLRAPIVLSRLALPYLAEAGAGAIVNVGSLAGRTPVPNSATYSASKSGLRAFSHALAEELRGTAIKVALVSPGPIDTGFIMADVDSVSDLTFSQPISTAAEVAAVILDLCSSRQVERSMPALSGFLTTLTYVMPWLRRGMRPALERKGARVKRRIKSERKTGSSD